VRKKNFSSIQERRPHNNARCHFFDMDFR